MHEANANATGSAPEHHPVDYHRPVRRKRGVVLFLHYVRRFWLPLSIMGVALFFALWLSASTTKPASQCVFKIPENPDVRPVRMTTCVTLEVARTDSAQTLGLSGRESMLRERGMLFDFAEPSRQCMWMKDMKFALDMLWLDEQGSVIHIEKDVRPESYPNSYCGPNNSKYVIELNAGIVDQAGLHAGQKLEL